MAEVAQEAAGASTDLPIITEDADSLTPAHRSTDATTTAADAHKTSASRELKSSVSETLANGGLLGLIGQGGGSAAGSSKDGGESAGDGVVSGKRKPAPGRKDSREKLLALHNQKPIKPEDEQEVVERRTKRMRSRAEWDITVQKFHTEVTKVVRSISSPVSPDGDEERADISGIVQPADNRTTKIDAEEVQLDDVFHIDRRADNSRSNSGDKKENANRDDCDKCCSQKEAARVLSDPQLSPITERPGKEGPELELLPVPSPNDLPSGPLTPEAIRSAPPLISVHDTSRFEHRSSVPNTESQGHYQLKKSKSVTFQGSDASRPNDLIISVPDTTETRRARLDSDKRGSRTFSMGSTIDDNSDGGSSPAAKGHRKLSRRWSNFSFKSTFSFRSMDGRTSSVSSALNGIGGNSIDVETEVPKEPCKCTKQHAKAAVGVLVMAVGAICWVAATKFTQTLLRWPMFYAPFFMVYFCSCWMVVCFPGYVIARVCKTRCRLSFKDTFRDNFRVFTADALAPCAPHKVIAKLTAFTVIWMLTCYVYVRALGFKTPLDVVALFGTNSNFVYLMSWIVLQKKFIAVRIVSFIVAMTGIIMITYVESGIASEDMWGSVLVMVGTAGAAAYKVLFRKIFGEVTYGQLSMFITCLGLFLAATMWPFLLLFYFTKTEPIVWPDVPWGILTVVAALILALQIVLTYGTVITHQPFVQASFVFAIPVCVVAEVLWNWDNFSAVGMQIAAYVLIILSFLLNVLPEDWHETVLKVLHWKPRQDWPEDAHMTPRQRIRHTGVRQV